MSKIIFAVDGRIRPDNFFSIQPSVIKKVYLIYLVKADLIYF